MDACAIRIMLRFRLGPMVRVKYPRIEKFAYKQAIVNRLLLSKHIPIPVSQSELSISDEFMMR